jgi:3-phenylpropionate/trans-cinnamate dioxygenase ferredoxin component
MIWSSNQTMFNYVQQDPSQISFVEIALESDVSIGERLFVEIDGLPIVVFNIAGELFAIGDVCTHDNGPLGDGLLDGHTVVCPRHGAEFDIRTGKALTLPAVVDIPAYPVRVVEGKIEVGIPKK